MFARWLFVKLQAAEKTLDEGRIDEAFVLACEPEVREHRRGQKVLDGLAKALVARARLHSQGGRYAEAVLDLDRLEVIGRAGSDAREIRERAVGELAKRQGKRDERDDVYERAAADLRAGRLDSGRLAVERVNDERQRRELEEELDIRVKRSGQLMEQARAALRAGDLPAACRIWTDARTRHGSTAEGETFGRQLASEYRKTIDHWLSEGRLERIVNTVQGTRELQRFDPTLREYETIAGMLAEAAGHLSRGRFHDARAVLMRVCAAGRDTAWAKSSLSAIEKIIELQTQLMASPLGVFAPAVEKKDGIGTAKEGGGCDNRGLNGGFTAAETRPARIGAAGFDDGRNGENLGLRRPMLLLVDGTGSTVLLRRETVRIGRAGGDPDIDVPLPSDVQSHHADVIRDGEDYFLMAFGPVEVNGRRVTRTLLRDGDRISLSANARMTFRKPGDRSESAVLAMSDRCRLPQDVDRVVLFKDTCLIGPDPSSHIRTREGDSRLVVFVRDGQLCIRPRPRNDRGNSHEVVALQPGETKDFGDIRLTLKAYQVKWSAGNA